MRQTTITISDKEVLIPIWNLEKQLQNQNIVMPLLKEPVVNAMAFASAGDNVDEAMFIATVIDGVMEALASVDMLKLVNILMDGVGFRNSKGVMVSANISSLDEAGFDQADVLNICVNIIKENYGSLLKKGLTDSLQTIMGEMTQ